MHIDVIRKNGFALEEDPDAPPGQHFKLKAVPLSKNITFGVEDVKDLISNLADNHGECAILGSYRMDTADSVCPSRVRAMLASLACRSSVMIGDALGRNEVQKAKVLREVMNQRLEAWKQILDVSGDISPPPQSQASSKENASDGRYAPWSRNYAASAGSEASHLSWKPIPANRSTPPESSYATTARKRSPFKSNEMISVPAMSQKSDRKKPSNRKVEVIPKTSFQNQKPKGDCSIRVLMKK